jgi:SAM-dependent methyltransferase
MSRQEWYRAEYRRLRAHWTDSLKLYRALVAENLPQCGAALDVGCGHADWLAPELDKAAFACGLDPDLGALRRNGAYRHLTAASAERLPFRDSTLDLVAMAWVLEHLEQPSAALCEIHRVLKPGGRLVFLTPNTWNYNVWLIRLVPNRLHDVFTRRLYDRQERDTYPVRYRANSPRRLGRALRAAGFRRRQLLANGDPTYISFNGPLFVLACGIEQLLNIGRLRWLRVHLLGVFEK